ncbi:MAG: acyl-CoA synthetase [Acidimicrobiales bacterium]|nr:acyl-CoA synthetase [Acidimicrobiales bacterium]
MTWNMADLFELVADAVPERECLVAGDRRLTYAQLEERSNRLAHYLATQGVGKDSHIGVYAYNCTEWMEAFLAALKLRAAAVNVNFRYVEDELRYLFKDADLAAVVHGPEFDPPFDGPTLEIGADYEAALAAQSPERDFGPRADDDRYILYTGGTTGMPKGVLWRHDDAFFAMFGGGNYSFDPVTSPEQLAEQARNAGEWTFLIVPPLMHGAGQWVTGSALFEAKKAVLLDGAKFDPTYAWDLVERERVNSMTIVGDAMARPLADAFAANPGRWDTSTLLAIGSGGAPLSPTVKEQLATLLPNTMVLDSFGSSETGYQGRATEGRRFTVDDTNAVFDDDLHRVPAGSGVVGRLAKTGRIPLGYYNDPEKTAKTFVEVEGKRWSFPGDLATVEDDGTINLLGRGSSSINSGGEKIYPEEVEDTLKAHPEVYDALVVGVPDERWGERVTAVVQARPGASPSLEDLQAHCRANIAGYKVPRALFLVDQVQRQPSGKPDYKWAKSVAAGEGS